MSALVSVQNLHKNFGDFHAVSGVSLGVNKGEVLGFLGPNGAGKTTTMRMLTGYLIPTEGKIEICGVDVLEDPRSAQKHIGYLPEGGPLYNDMTPATFLRFIANIRGLKGGLLDERMDYVVKNLNLSNVFNQTIDTLSKGYKRRVALAQAIIHDPEVLILDEPTDGLDPNQKHEVRELISAMAKNKAIIISTHILEEVDAICSNAIIIANGKVVAAGTPQELARKAPSHNAVVIRLKQSPADKVLNDILQVNGVERVSVEGTNKVIAYSKNSKDILAEVGDAVRNKKVAVEEIYARVGALDDAFRALTKDADAS
jgi:ABC-2 type transport system ATP-binding protein